MCVERNTVQYVHAPTCYHSINTMYIYNIAICYVAYLGLFYYDRDVKYLSSLLLIEKKKQLILVILNI